MTTPDISRFSLSEAFSTSTGKTSISLICGFIVTITGCLGFATSGVLFLIMTVWTHTKDVTIINAMSTLIFQAVMVITIGTTLLGIRRFTAEKTGTSGEPIGKD
jgi:hypothetical protein